MNPRAQRKEIDARIGRIQDAESIFTVAHFEEWLVNTVNEDLVASYTIRVKHVWDLVIYVELPVGDCQRQVEGP